MCLSVSVPWYSGVNLQYYQYYSCLLQDNEGKKRKIQTVKEKTKCGVTIKKRKAQKHSIERRPHQIRKKNIFGFFGFINTIKMTNG